MHVCISESSKHESLYVGNLLYLQIFYTYEIISTLKKNYILKKSPTARIVNSIHGKEWWALLPTITLYLKGFLFPLLFCVQVPAWS